jgi:hypothetical protein
MARTRVQGVGPVEITDPKSGQLIVLPLSELYFEGGALKADGDVYAKHKLDIDPLLVYLKTEGLVVPAEQAAPTPAAVVKAKRPGSAGNNIRLKLSNVRPDTHDPNKTIFDAALEQHDVHERLDPKKLGDVLGSSADAGNPADLVFVPSSGEAKLPKNGNYIADGSGVTVPAASGTGDAFKVTFRVVDTGAKMTVDVSGSDAAQGTFTLTANWVKAVAGIRIDELDSDTNFGKMIVVKPPEGGSLDVPSPGTVFLGGGADAAAAQPASATAVR